MSFLNGSLLGALLPLLIHLLNLRFPELFEFSSMEHIRKTVSPSATSGFFVAGHEDLRDLVLGKPVFHCFILAGIALLLAELPVQFFFTRKSA